MISPQHIHQIQETKAETSKGPTVPRSFFLGGTVIPLVPILGFQSVKISAIASWEVVEPVDGHQGRGLHA